MGKVAGLRCRDETGKVILSITDRICRYLGEASTGFENGYVTDDVFLEDVSAWMLPKNISLQYDSLGNKTLEYPINTNACFLGDANLSKKAITISADINVLGTSGKPFVTRVQYYVYIWSNRTYLMAAWFAGLTSSAIRNVSIAHMIVDTSYN